MIEIQESPRWLRVSEARNLLNVSDSTVRRWLADDKLRGFKDGGVVRVDRESIDRFVEARPYKASGRAGKMLTTSGWRRRLLR